ncbi:nitrite reductase small subunit NirD [Gordonia hydrophobica]|uniref:Nitrite reductase small subunit NirD n=1 Tax=Gordonia hydrophobica TaxID=40516 RepID=A0ABZ2U444_9ACTN|nr:nitrite reductase small subunit NirD [Gordonia hydrophobica]MBM7368453.1 nitrite reductase (NADH) small subunit [Gordonia hydrophobica]
MTIDFDLHRWTRDWTAACRLDRLERLRGVAVLLPDGAQVALFRLADDSLRAVGNIDPIGRAAVLSRGIVGDRNGFPVVASPLKKQAFSLIDGRCLDSPGVRIPVYGTRIGLDGTVFVANSPDIRFGFRPTGFGRGAFGPLTAGPR